MRTATSVLTIAGLLLAGLVHAAPLTDEQITGFAASLPEVEALVEEHEAAGGVSWNDEALQPRPGQIWAPMSGAVGEMQSMPYYDDFLAIIGEHGFDDADEWGAIGDRITRAMMALQLAQEDPEFEADMAAALEELEANPDLTPEQKAMMREALGAAMQVVQTAADAPAEDVEAVRPHMDAIMVAMDDEDEEDWEDGDDSAE
jgi:hypothetical protein